MSLSTSRSKLVSSLKDLHSRWDRVRMQWEDKVAKDFEDEFLGPLDGKVRGGVSAIEHMNELMMRARRECG
jgi:hypothetical protein